MSTVSDMMFHLGGVPVNAPFMHVGKAWFVRPGTGSDGNSGKTPDRALATLSAALGKATANKDEVVYLIAESNTAGSTTDYQSATLNWNKDGVHLVGIGNGSLIGSRSRIAQLSTAAAVGSLVKVSANNCLIANLEIFQGVNDITDTAPIALEVTGQRNVIRNCQISGIGHDSQDVAGARSLKLSGSENIIEDCYIGLDTISRDTATIEVELSGAPTRNIFRNCHFRTYATVNTFLLVSIAAGMDRFTLFDRCIFSNAQNISSATTVTAVMDAAAINGEVIIRDPMMSGFTNMTAADAARVKVLGLNGLATGHLIGVSAGVDVT